MILTCPSCSAKFVVKAELIGTTGRKVRCAKCKHDWFQEPADESIAAVAAIAVPEPQQTEPVPEGSNLPTHVVVVPSYIKLAFAGIAFLALFLSSIIFSNSILPHLSWYYSILGIHDTQGLALYDVSVEKVGEEKENDLLVKGRIVNESKDEKIVPIVKITVMDDGHNKIQTITLASSNEKLAPGEGVDFENRIPKLPENVATIVMDLGNSLDLAAR